MIRYRVGRRTTVPNLFILSGGKIDFADGDITLTQSANTLTLAGGNFVHTVGTLAADAVGFTLTATQPASPTAAQNAVSWSITGAGSAAQANRAVYLDYLAGYTGNQSSQALYVENANAGTNSADPFGANMSSGNIAIVGRHQTAAADTRGVVGDARGGTTRSLGVFGYANPGSGGTGYGVLGIGDAPNTNAPVYGGYFRVRTVGSSATAALVGNNASTTADIFQAMDNDVVKVFVPDGGDLQLVNPKPTAGSGTGVTVNSAGSVQRLTYKVTVTYAALAAAATTADKVIATIPAKQRLVGIITDTTTKYIGGAVTATTLIVGKTTGGNEYIVSHDVFTAAITRGLADADLGTSINRANAIQGGDLPSFTATTDVSVRLTTTTANTDALTQGSTTYYLVTELMP